MNRIIAAFAAFAFMFSPLLADETVRGTVFATDAFGPLEGATVRLILLSDTTKVRGVVTDKKGAFVIKDVAPGTYKVVAKYVGYKPEISTIFVRNKSIDLGLMRMKVDELVTKDVEVEGVAQRVEIKGDTTEYNAAAFKTNPNANAEDLIKKMPGITVENGTVRAQGEDVKKVLVDGREFFGDDVSGTLRNVPAEMVDRVQVYDRGSDMSMFSGFDDGTTTKTINLKTRKDKKNGQFGRAYGGYGTDQRFSGGATLNNFDDAMRLSIFGLTNNINQQNFSFQDIVGSMGIGGRMGSMMTRYAGMGGGARMLSGGGGGFGGGRSGGDFSSLFVGGQNGITTTHSLGVNYSDVLGSNINTSGSYFFNYADNNQTNGLNRNYVQPQGQTYDEESATLSLNRNHRFNLRMESYIDTLNAISFTPRFTYQGGSNTVDNSGLTVNDTLQLTKTQSTNGTQSNGFVAAGTLTWRHKLNQEGTSISTSVSTDYQNGSSSGSLNAVNDYYTIPTSDSLNQINRQATDGITLSGTVAVTQPMRSSDMIQLSYSPSFTKNTSDKKTFGFDDGSNQYSILDPALSSVFDNNYNTHRGTGLYRFREDNTIITFGGSYQFATLTGAQSFPTAQDVNRTFSNFLPQLMWQQQFTKTNSLRLFYRTYTSPPSVTQLQNVVDNSNPVQLRVGNPALDQSYTHNASVRYSNADWMAGRSMFGFLSASLTNNYIGTATVIARTDTVLASGVNVPAGTQISEPVNLSGNVSIRSFMTYGFPVQALGSNLNLNGGVSYSRTPGRVNGFDNFANNTTLNGGFFLGSTVSENLDFTVSYNGAYNIVINSLQKASDANYFTHSATGKLIWNLGAVACSTDVNNTLYQGLGVGYDRVFTVWNAGIGYRFLDKRAAEIRLTVFDILRQNASVNRSINDIYVEDSRQNVITQYAMITFSYDLKNFGN